MAKAKEPYSASLGPDPSLEWIALDRLTVDPRYQRQLGKKNFRHIRRIVANFKWQHYQPIIVTEAGDERFAVIDGQHRLEAARRHPRIDSLPCYVVDAPSVADQAGVFIAANSQRIGLSRIHHFWAAHAAGDEMAMRIHTLCADTGVTIQRTPSAELPPLTTVATFTIEKLLATCGGGAIAAALRVLATAHPKDRNVFRSCHIAALSRLAASVGPAFDETGMTARLERLDLDYELGRAKTARARTGGSLEAALQEVYRKHYERPLVAQCR